MPQTLMQLLNAVYAAKHLNMGTIEGTTSALKEAIKKDNSLWAQALARQASLQELERHVGGELHQRDAIGAVHLEALNEALK